jgi:SAM-dependent methyltransferase
VAAVVSPVDVGSEVEAPRAPSSGRGLVALFTLASFVGSTLLFLVQPLVAKLLTPLLGGTPDVWNTAMVFFQAELLLGYGVAHLAARRLGRRQVPIHLLVVAIPLLALPLAVPGGWVLPEGTAPALWTLLVLGVMVGLPFLALSTASPTFQRWFSLTGHQHADDPYFLYAAGNVGSLLALLAYPLVLEPNLSTSAQSRLWSIGYVLFVALTAACAIALRRRAGTVGTVPAFAAPTSPPLGNRLRLRLVGFAFVPSLLMLGVTRHLSTDIASIPLLWVVPLSLYLLSFVLAFGRRTSRLVDLSSRAVALLAVPLAASFAAEVGSVWLAILPHLAFFLAAAVLAHARVAEARPAPDRLTEFYLWISIGGVLGGIAGALIAPVVFTSILEYPLALGLAVALRPAVAGVKRGFDTRAMAVGALLTAGLAIGWLTASDPEAARLTVMALALVGGGAYVLVRQPRFFAAAVAGVLLVTAFTEPNATLHAERTFFGVHRVFEDAAGRHVLANGTTTHGLQDPADPGTPLGYYHPDGPIGDVFTTAEDAPPRAVGLIGLGSGALAAYGRSGDSFTYFEIDPAVAHIASDPTLFTYLSDSEADTDIVLGDGRRSLDRTDAVYDLLVLDAFSSDAIPIHLLTAEAVQEYVQHLTPGGVLAVHISNRYFDLAPVVRRLADELGLTGRRRIDPSSPELEVAGRWSSQWVVLAGDPASVDRLTHELGWGELPPAEGRLWTDDYSDLLGALEL